MEVRILGAHNLETATSRLSSLVIDGVLALDAGSLTSGLTLEEQARLKAARELGANIQAGYRDMRLQA